LATTGGCGTEAGRGTPPELGGGGGGGGTVKVQSVGLQSGILLEARVALVVYSKKRDKLKLEHMLRIIEVTSLDHRPARGFAQSARTWRIRARWN
jgi:hypothetical protein